MAAFFLNARPTDLATARGVTQQQLEGQLNQEFGPDAVAQGQQIFARTCAGCHSSQENVSENTNFRATDPADPTRRIDFLSNEKPILASRVGTHAGARDAFEPHEDAACGTNMPPSTCRSARPIPP